jgi:hypothetical protein
MLCACIHGLEHLSLTLSVAFGAKQAIGLPTWFGLLDPGPGLRTYRIWWHLIANVIGSVIFGAALFCPAAITPQAVTPCAAAAIRDVRLRDVVEGP